MRAAAGGIAFARLDPVGDVGERIPVLLLFDEITCQTARGFCEL
jgi:hypothetical protein